MPKLTRFITSFAAVLGTYWLYVLLVVPLIEPAAAGPQNGAAGESRRGAARRINNRLGELQQLVPPEARAQLQTPWIIESDDFKLLMQKYTNRDDGRVMIEPCVLIFTPGSSPENAEPKPPIVLYAPAGAMMVFGRPLDLRTGDVDCPTSGRLLGEITITSPGQSSGPEDDLHIETRDVQLTADQISTTNAVDFRYGASVGRGRNFVIKLQRDEKKRGSPGDSPNVKGIESFELVELEHLHLEPPKKEDASTSAAEVRTGPADLDTKRPLEITCQGRFRFDLVGQVATFQDQVNVLQLNPEGEADQLNCELLTLSFSRSRKGLQKLDGKQPPTASLGTESIDLELRKIEATGNPVIVRAFSRDAEARGEWLSYDVQQDSVALGRGEEVFLRQGPNEFHARSISYKSRGKGRLGEIFSQGPGRMKGRMRDRPDQEIFVEWGDRLQMEPFDDQHLATLSGGVRLEYAGVGTLTAERIDLWLFELPAGPDREKLEVVPDRMLVQNQVKINAPEVSGTMNELQIWFEQRPDTSPVASSQGPLGSNSPGGSEVPSPSPMAGPFQPRAAGEPIERRYHVRGDLVQARFLVRDEKAELAELMLENEVELDEIPLIPSSGNEQPMHVEGDRIQVFEAHDTTRTKISVIGRAAEFRGRGVMLSGTNINVDAGTNRLWIDGAGAMKLPLDRDLEGKPLQHPDEVTITWQKEMDFVDGIRAQFEEKVEARTRDQLLRTAILEVQFLDRIDFRSVRSNSRPKAELAQIACRGGVFMEGRTYEAISVQPGPGGNGLMHPVNLPADAGMRPPQQESWEEFVALELTINRRTGDIFAQGPGRITTIQRKSGELFPTRQVQVQPAAESRANGNKLAYLHVEFPQVMTGNIELGEVTFAEHVRCVYEEVVSWQARLDVHDPDSLSASGVLLTADRLTVAEAPGPAEGAKSIELQALGNVTAENASFTARADRMTYSQAKDWLILVGNGYAPAELSFQEYLGATPRSHSATEIHFRPETKEVKIVDGRSLQLDSLPMR